MSQGGRSALLRAEIGTLSDRFIRGRRARGDGHQGVPVTRPIAAAPILPPVSLPLCFGGLKDKFGPVETAKGNFYSFSPTVCRYHPPIAYSAYSAHKSGRLAYTMRSANADTHAQLAGAGTSSTRAPEATRTLGFTWLRSISVVCLISSPTPTLSIWINSLGFRCHSDR
jgi:hypothetical protein